MMVNKDPGQPWHVKIVAQEAASPFIPIINTPKPLTENVVPNIEPIICEMCILRDMIPNI